MFPEPRPGARGPFKPFRAELDLADLEVSGEIPEAVIGAYYRCGPDKQFPPAVEEHWPAANGDGMMSAFFIGRDRVDFRMRYVLTERLKAERAAGRALFGAYRNPYTDDPSVAGLDRTVANTAAIWCAGRLLACKEDGLPYEIDPLTLETRGRFDFDGQLASRTFAAHPKFDPATGEMVFFGGQIDGLTTRRMMFGTVDPSGRIVRQVEFDAPYAGMMHDFAVTGRYVVFPFVPVTTDQARVEAGGPFWAWDPSLPAHIAVIPRDGGEGDIRWFSGPAFWSWHTMNAFEDGEGGVHLDTTVASHHWIFPDVQGAFSEPAPFFPTRISCDLGSNSGRFSMRELAHLPSDFYGCDPRHSGRPYRYGYMGAIHPDLPPAPGFNAVVRLDHETGDQAIWPAGPGSAIQEPVFVPRRPGAPEGDGFILVVVNDYPAVRAELRVLDAMRPGEPPVAAVRLPFTLPTALHGVFVAEGRGKLSQL